MKHLCQASTQSCGHDWLQASSPSFNAPPGHLRSDQSTRKGKQKRKLISSLSSSDLQPPPPPAAPAAGSAKPSRKGNQDQDLRQRLHSDGNDGKGTQDLRGRLCPSYRRRVHRAAAAPNRREGAPRRPHLTEDFR
jgi:hypothetical protein